MSEGLNPELPRLVLRRGEDARLRAGHLWVYSNEVDVQRSPLAAFTPGAACVVVDAGGKFVGSGYVNPASLIAARLLRREPGALDAAFFAARITRALALRQRLYDSPHYRLLYGESDGVPGLTLDRYGDVLVAQATTAGIERCMGTIEQAVRTVLAPRALVWKNDAGIRALENLPSYTQLAFSEVAGGVEVIEAGLRFAVDVLEGQKTGWFYDQRANRDRFVRHVGDARVLDVFSYLGGWGLRAAQAGARAVLCVDASQPALQRLQQAAQTNALAARVGTRQGDAFEVLKALREAGERFDAVVVDPPAFIKRRKDLAAGRLAYRRINALALSLLAPEGVLVSCSCSHHLSAADLLSALQAAAQSAGRELQVLENLQQGPDHPVHPAIPETAYLKGYLCRVLPV